MHILFLIAALKLLSFIAVDVASAYIQDMNGELVYNLSGKQFGPCKDNIFIIINAHYGFKPSGDMWYHKLSDILRDMVFYPCIAYFYLCMQDFGDHHEYVAIMVDDLLILIKRPELIISPLEETGEYNFKGVGDPTY